MEYPEVKFIKDAGLTQVPKGSLTCVGFVSTPALRKVTEKLKLV